jgi:hypothetical protein
MKHPERFSSLFFILFSLLILSQSWKLHIGSVSKPDSGFFPIIIAILLLFLSLILFVKSILEKQEKKLELGFSYFGIGVTVSTMVLYAFFVDFLGYLLCTFIAGVILTKLVQKRTWGIALVFSILYSAISYFGFKIVGVPLPQGVIYFI